MEIKITATPKEIADLVSEIQSQPKNIPIKFGGSFEALKDIIHQEKSEWLI